MTSIIMMMKMKLTKKKKNKLANKMIISAIMNQIQKMIIIFKIFKFKKQKN